EENKEFFKGINHSNYLAWRNATKRSALFTPFVDLSNAVGTVILIAFGSHLILQGDMKKGLSVFLAFSLGGFGSLFLDLDKCITNFSLQWLHLNVFVNT